MGYARAVLRRALAQAVNDKLILTNPAAGHGLVPKLERREMHVLSGAQVNALLDATRDDPHGPLWTVLLTTGLRPSEALALKWADLDLGRGDLRVVRKLRRPANGSTWVLEDCKTAKGRRVVPLIPLAVDALTRHRDRQQVERLIAGEGYREAGFVFADPRGNPLRADGLYKYHWQPMLKRLNLPPVRLYDARHSAATMLLESGVPMKVVQEVLGHSSMAVTADVYSHVTPAFKRQAADALAGLPGPCGEVGMTDRINHVIAATDAEYLISVGHGDDLHPLCWVRFGKSDGSIYAEPRFPRFPAS